MIDPPSWSATYRRPSASAQKSSAYKSGIGADFRVLERLLTQFAPHEQDVGSPAPGMEVRLEPGFIWQPSGPTLTEVAAQTVGGFTTPSAGQNRIDRVVVDAVTGIASRIAGVAATGSPSATPPPIPYGKLPNARVTLTDADTAITDAMITDERVVGDAASLDGAGLNGNYLTRSSLDGAADSKTGILSMWLRIDGGDGNLMDILAAFLADSPRFRVFRGAFDNLLTVQGNTSVGTTALNLISSSAYPASATWIHLLASWDLASGQVAGAHFYINDVDDLSGTVTFSSNEIDYTGPDWCIGGSTPAGSNRYNGALAELYFAPGQYLDFSVEANRRKFISAGRPVPLGDDGALPTGVAPLVFEHLDDDELADHFANNRGTGGDFTVIGSPGLTTASTSPAD